MAGGAKAERTVSDRITLAQNLDSLAVCFQSHPQSSMNEDSHPNAVYWENIYVARPGGHWISCRMWPCLRSLHTSWGHIIHTQGKGNR